MLRIFNDAGEVSTKGDYSNPIRFDFDARFDEEFVQQLTLSCASSYVAQNVTITDSGDTADRYFFSVNGTSWADSVQFDTITDNTTFYIKAHTTADETAATLRDVKLLMTYELKPAATPNFYYSNPGDADLLAVTGVTTVNTDFSQSVTGKAFYGGSQVDMFNTPELSEVWMRFDMFYKAGGAISTYDRRVACGFFSNAENRYIGFTNIYTGGRNSGFKLTGNVSFYVPHDVNSFNQCLLHIKCGAPGCVELTINGATYTYTGTVNAGQPTDTLYLYCDNSYCIFSNVTVSDSPLTMDEGYRRDLFSVETEVTAPVLNVRWQGENHQFKLTTKKSTPAVAVRVGGRNFYAPIVNENDALASAVRLLLDDTNRALKT